MIDSFLNLTFGVEFEAIIAFHETTLQKHLDNTHNTSKIIKDIPDDVRRELNQTNRFYSHIHKQYTGWGLTTPAAFTVPDQDVQVKLASEIEKFGYRGYAGEILGLAQNLFPDGVRVHDSFREKYHDFESWHLTHDRSVVGVDKDTLERELVLAGREVNNIDDWDSHSIELVSRVLPLEPASFNEINTYLAALRGSPDSLHAAFTNIHCGFHVHVGLPEPKDLPQGAAPPTFALPILQHLAYILVMYELAISKLFPAHRREGSAAAMIDLQTNLDNFIEEPVWDGGKWDESEFPDLANKWFAGEIKGPADVAIAELEKLGIEDSTDSGYGPTPFGSPEQRLRLLETPKMEIALASAAVSPLSASRPDIQPPSAELQPPPAPAPAPSPAPAPAPAPVPESEPPLSFSKARAKIFTQDMTIDKLATLMCGTTKGHIANWTYLPRTNGLARTIEFRQHQGTLDKDDVRWWVEFCGGMVKLAERNAREFGAEEGYGGEGYKWLEWSSELGVENLLDMMEMEEVGRVHFWGMAERGGDV